MVVNQVVEFTDKIKNRKELVDSTLHRIYYYDAEPLTVKQPKPLTGSRGNWLLYDFSNTAVFRSNKQLLSDLKKSLILPYDWVNYHSVVGRSSHKYWSRVVIKHP